MRTSQPHRKVVQHSYDSLDEFASHQNANRNYRLTGSASSNREFSGVSSFSEAVNRAKAGLPEVGVRALDASKSLTDAVSRQIEAIDMHSVFDVSGAYVDMGRFVTGEPECMIENYIQTTNTQKPVVTIVCNVAASAGVDKRDLEERGRLVVALVKAIEMSGRTTELFADFTCTHHWSEPKDYFRVSVKVKNASAPLDMGAVMYAFSDPSMLRVLCFNAMHEMPKDMRQRYSVPGCYGYPAKGENYVAESYGADAVYIPATRLGDNAEKLVTDILKRLGIA